MKEDVRARGTHGLDSANEQIGDENKRNPASERHSRPGGRRGASQDIERQRMTGRREQRRIQDIMIRIRNTGLTGTWVVISLSAEDIQNTTI
jgi:hypothetical protein